MEQKQNGQREKREREPRITIRLRADVRRALNIRAAQEETSVQALVEPAITALVESK